MADLSNPLTQVAVAQAQPAVTVNNLVDALSPAACFGQNDLTTTGLTWGYYGGRFNGIAIAASTIALPASQATIYIVANKSTGVVSQSTSITNWNDTTNYQRLFIATTGSSTIIDWDDYREFIASGLGGGSATWGAISGTLSAQSDLQSALDNKVPANTFEEQVQDICASLITAGSNVTKQYNDGDSPATLVLSAAAGGTSLTQEEVEDICASLITAGSGVTKQYNDGDSPATLVLSASGGGGTPGGSDTQVQYNNAGAFGGSAKFTWIEGSRTLYINDGVGTTPAVFGTPTQTTAATAGQAMTVQAGNGLGAGGGNLSLLAGTAATAGAGGQIIATCGSGVGAGVGGAFSISGGQGGATGAGGTVTLQGGAGGTGVAGGTANFNAGNGGVAGSVNLQAGNASSAGFAGGNVRFRCGTPGSGGPVGDFLFQTSGGAATLATLFGGGKLNIGAGAEPTVKFKVEGSTCVTATAVTATTTTTLNLATTNVQKVAMNANITTLTVSNPSDTQEVTIIFTQDGTGNRTITWPASFKWAGGAVPVLSTAAGEIDMYTGIYNSTTTSYLGRLEKAFA